METRTAPISSVDEAIQRLEVIRAMHERIQQVPGLAEGELEKLYEDIKKLIKAISEASRRQYRSLGRALNETASHVSSLYEDGLLSKKHTKLFDKVLAKMKMKDLYSARKLLTRFDDIISLKEEMNELLGEYRRFYNGLGKDITSLKGKLDRLRNVPRPAMAQSDVEALTNQFRECRDVVNLPISRYVSTYPSREVLRTMLWGTSIPDLRIPAPSNPQAAEDMVTLLGSAGDAKVKFGDKNIHVLLGASNYTEARFKHILKDPRRLQYFLQENRAWLKELTSMVGYGPRLSLDEDANTMRVQIAAWLELLDRIPGSKEAKERLGGISKMLESGRFATAQESIKIYKRYGDTARMAWDGKIKVKIKNVEESVRRLERNLERLPHPDEVIG